MTDFNDPQDFFQRGDDGTYDGGPSQPPPADVADLELGSLPPVSASQRERRARFTRLVTAIVIVLGLGSTVVFARHALSEDAASESAAPLVAGPDDKSDRPAAEPAVAARGQLPAARPAPAVTPRPAEPTEQKPPPIAVAPPEPPPAAAPTSQPPPSRPLPKRASDQVPRAASPRSAGKRVATSQPPPSRPLPKRASDQVPRTASRRSAGRRARMSLSSQIKQVSATDTASVRKSGHAPPTARFSD